MEIRRALLFGASRFWLIVVAAGCGSPHEASVSGTVTLDGRALDRGTVSFHPTGGGPIALGEIDPHGNYTLRTGASPGLTPGQYAVTVLATEDPIPSPTGYEAPLPGGLITPVRYSRPGDSDLLVTVNDGANQIDFALQTK